MLLWIGLGGIAGAICRYRLGSWAGSRWGTAFPWGTFLINISGSALLGMLFMLHETAALSSALWGLLGIGFCGAYTTFSTFGYETVQLLGKGQYGHAVLYVIGSTVLAVAAAGLGMLFMWFLS